MKIGLSILVIAVLLIGGAILFWPKKEAVGTVKAAATKNTYSLTEVSTHNTANNCWMVIRGDVYDVTSYIPMHPGGQEIIRGCGMDATQMFATEGMMNGRPHPSRAEAILATLKIGSLQI